MKFSHHSRHEDWEFDPTIRYVHDSTFKPRGLWLSVDGDWERWCRDDSGWWPGYTSHIMFDVDLTKVLHISDTEGLRDLTTALSSHKHPNQYVSSSMMQWPALVDEFAGIVIAPYLWQARFDEVALWYYSWDAASACIWDLSIVTPSGEGYESTYIEEGEEACQ